MDNGRIKELEKLIRHHNKLYWEENRPEIADAEYDNFVRELTALDPKNPLLNELNSPVVGAIGQIKYIEPMLSLDKVYSFPEVLEWANKYAVEPDTLLQIQPKYDGLSAYFDGKELSTRSDKADIGELVSDKIRLIRLEDGEGEHELDRPVRGEIVVRLDRFPILQKIFVNQGNKVYKNSRNILAGIMMLKGNKVTQAEYGMKTNQAYLTMVDYDSNSIEVKLSDLDERSWNEALESLKQLPYPMDGMVIKFADPEFRKSLGFTEHHPRGEIAYKFQNISKESVLEEVEWSFGKNSLTPVAHIKPVNIGGITIKRASLHNAKNIVDKDIEIGDTVIVERAGDVIPYIESAIPGENRRTVLIDKCPGCHSPVIWKGPELTCSNPECFETLLQRLLAAVRSIGIEQLGEPTLRGMMIKLGVRHLGDIFKLKESDLLRLDNFGALKAEKLYKEIQKARRVTDYQLLASLNIPNVGQAVAKLILKKYRFSQLPELTTEQLSQVKGIGPERASGVVELFSLEKELLRDLATAVKLIESTGSMERQSVCFTGKMPRKRSYYAEIAQEAGYEVVDDVNSALDILVAADPGEHGSKLEKARKSGIEIISLDEWLAALPPQLLQNNNEDEPEQMELF